MKMTKEAMESRREYQRLDRSRNRNRINDKKRAWNSQNPDKLREYQRRYWEKRAGGVNLRASWSDYGIDELRRKELLDIAKSDKYAQIVADCAIKADEKNAGHILLSVLEGVSYEHLEFHERLGRCTLGRTNFFGARRLFFHYLDEAVKEQSENER